MTTWGDFPAHFSARLLAEFGVQGSNPALYETISWKTTLNIGRRDCKNAQGQSSHRTHCLLLGLAIDYHAGKVGDLSDPATDCFPFDFDLKTVGQLLLDSPLTL